MPNSKIKSIKAREILDSRGNPTIEVKLKTDNGSFLASVPSGASKGKYEAVELKDGGKRYKGKGVLKAVKNIQEIIGPRLKGMDPSRQKEIDELMIKLDGTKNKSKLGANAILAVSLVVCRAGAKAKNLPLYKYLSQLTENSSPSFPGPCFNILEGGAHAKNNLDIQEFMTVPELNSLQKNLKAGIKIYRILGKILKKKFHSQKINLGDEGGYSVSFKRNTEALEVLVEAIEKAGFLGKIKIGLDSAASNFYRNGFYNIERRKLNKFQLLNFYKELVKKYPIIFIEDPLFQDDWQGFQKITKELPETIVFGDDLTVTNPERIKLAGKKRACQGVIIKPNQIGTVTETLEAVKTAKSFGFKIMISHRAGETKDDFISDFAVGVGADFIKSGAPGPAGRMVKYKRLLEIEKSFHN